MNCKAYMVILLFVKKKANYKRITWVWEGQGKFSTELTAVSEAKATVCVKANTCKTAQQNNAPDAASCCHYLKDSHRRERSRCNQTFLGWEKGNKCILLAEELTQVWKVDSRQVQGLETAPRPSAFMHIMWGFRLWELSHGHVVAVKGDFFIPTNYFQEVQGQWHRELW